MADLDHLSAPHMAPPAPASRTLAILNSPACRACGCTEDAACIEPGGQPCAWAAPGLCTACVARVRRVFTGPELTFLLHAAGGGSLNLTRPSATALTAEGVLSLRDTLRAIAPQKEADDER